jgi:RNase_H superfamily
MWESFFIFVSLIIQQNKYMTNKQQLINYLLLEGKGPMTWLDLAIEFNLFPGESEKKRRRSTQDIWRSYCSKTIFEKKEIKEVKKDIKEGAKILIFDLETLPLLSFHWRLWKQNISHKTQMVKSEWNIVSWSAKWLGSDVIISDILTPKEIEEENDSRIVKQLWKLLDQADIVIAHNSKFDCKQSNSRFLKFNLGLPSSYKEICTYKASKKAFDLPSHSLDYIAKFMGLSQKMDTGGFQLWRDCLKGDKEALKKMLAYNEEDVLLLEKVYLQMRPYILGHPNVAVISDIEGCPCCGKNTLKENSLYHTGTMKYIEYRCTSCGALSKNKSAIKNLITTRSL